MFPDDPENRVEVGLVSHDVDHLLAAVFPRKDIYHRLLAPFSFLLIEFNHCLIGLKQIIDIFEPYEQKFDILEVQRIYLQPFVYLVVELENCALFLAEFLLF
jgi:hypothetical protein